MAGSVNADNGVWIVVPAFNEGARLAEALDSLCRHYPRVVVVDDGSADDTTEVAGKFPVYRLRHLINRGQGAAIRTGLDFALARGAEIMVTFDADGQHTADDVEQLVAPIRDGRVDVTLGSRFLGSADGLPWMRWLILKAGIVFTRIFSQLRVTDTHNGLRGFSRRAAQMIRITEDDFAHASEILDEVRRHRLPYCEVPVRIRYSASTLAKGQKNWGALRIAGRVLMGRLFR